MKKVHIAQKRLIVRINFRLVFEYAEENIAVGCEKTSEYGVFAGY